MNQFIEYTEICDKFPYGLRYIIDFSILSIWFIVINFVYMCCNDSVEQRQKSRLVYWICHSYDSDWEVDI